MKGVRLSKAFVESIDLADPKDRFFWDAAVPGFGIRARGGRLVYVVKCPKPIAGRRRGVRGRAKLHVIGEHEKAWRPNPETGKPRDLSFDMAKAEARRIRGLIADGQDPFAGAATGRGETFGVLARRMLAAAKLADSTRRSWAWVLERHAFAALGPLPATAVTRADVRALRRAAGGASDEVLKVVRWVYARALEEDAVETSPCVGMKASRKKPRQVVMTHAQIRGLWTSAGDLGGYGLGVRLAFLTAARRGAIFGGRRAEVDREAELWRVHANKGNPAYDLPIVPMMAEVLDAMGGRFPGSEWLIPSAGEGRKRHAPGARALHPTSRAWARLLRRAGIITADEEKEWKLRKTSEAERKQSPNSQRMRKTWSALPVRFHDIRRTVREILTRDLGVAVPVAEAVLGHLPPKIVRTYAPTGVALKDKRAALETWANELQRIVSGG